MISIDISEDVSNTSELSSVLCYIAEQLDSGYTSGVNPTWSIDGEEETEEDQ